MHTPRAILQDGREKKFQVFGVAKQGKELIPTLVADWRPSAVRGEEVRRFHEVAGVSIAPAGGPQQTLLTVDSRVASIKFK